MINKRRLIGNATAGVVQTIISGVVLFALYRYLIRTIGTEQLGLWSVILASTSVARLSDLGMTGSVVKFVARYRALKSNEEASEVVQTAALTIAAVMAALIVMIYPLLNIILKLVIPSSHMSQALVILPWAIISMWLSSVAGVFQSGLDGCQRIDLKNIILTVGNVFYLAAAIFLVPKYGLEGLAIGQVAQGVIMLTASWLILKSQLGPLPYFPRQWKKSKFREMFGYAVSFQISTIAIMFFDPATKILMSKFGGLSSTAYYEMASQLVIKLRALIISANQAIVPVIAELHENSPNYIREIYLKTYRLLFIVVFPFYACILISLPLASMLWIGDRNSEFILFGVFLAIGWGVNNLSGPAYYVNQGTGDLRWNTIEHILMAVINIVLGLMLGPIYGGKGVAFGTMCALIVGGLFVVGAVHCQYKISLSVIIPREDRVIVGALTTTVCLLLLYDLQLREDAGDIFSSTVLLLIYTLILGLMFWIHSHRKTTINKLLKLIKARVNNR